MEASTMGIAQKGRMSERWQADNRPGAPLIRRRFIAVIAVCVVLVGAAGLILWATGTNSAAGVSPSVTALVQTSNELVEKTGAMEATEQQTVDQLQVVQDQLGAQQAEMKKLAVAIETLNAKLDALAQSASAMPIPSAGTDTPASKAARRGRN
jgi:predicted PurR-regulated permease PerM